MSIYRAQYVWIYVEDMEKAQSFYSEVLHLNTQPLPAPLHSRYRMYDLQPIQLVVAVATTSEERDHVGRWTGLSLTVPDIEATVNHLAGQGVVIVNEPAKQPWGGVQAAIEDWDGNVIGLVGG